MARGGKNWNRPERTGGDERELKGVGWMERERECDFPSDAWILLTTVTSF